MIRVCCSNFHVGDRVFGEKEPLDDKQKTHGICKQCFPKEMADIEEKMKEIRKKKKDGWI